MVLLVQAQKGVKITYFCNTDGGYKILKDDIDRLMPVMMPLGVSIYETSDGRVYIGGINLQAMRTMFRGTPNDVLGEDAERFARTLEGIVEET